MIRRTDLPIIFRAVEFQPGDMTRYRFIFGRPTLGYGRGEDTVFLGWLELDGGRLIEYLEDPILDCYQRWKDINQPTEEVLEHWVICDLVDQLSARSKTRVNPWTVFMMIKCFGETLHQGE